MANFKIVNQEIKREFPTVDVEVIRGEGYIYYIGSDVESIDSLYTHPVSTSTDDVVCMCIEDIKDFLSTIQKV